MHSSSPARAHSRLLLVESDASDASLVQEALSELEEPQYRKLLPWFVELHHAESFEEAVACLTENAFDIILLDLDLEDSLALHTYLGLKAVCRSAPVVILCGAKEEYTALTAMREGAFSYLIKEDLDCLPLARTLRSAMERQQAIVARAEMPMADELTTVLSREGFILLGEHSLHLAARWQRPATLFLVVLTGYSLLENAFGRQAQDLALIETGDLLRSVFQNSDLVARLKENTFATLCFDDPAGLEPVDARIQRYLQALSPFGVDQSTLLYLTTQITFLPTPLTTVDQLLLAAEKQLPQPQM